MDKRFIVVIGSQAWYGLPFSAIEKPRRYEVTSAISVLQNFPNLVALAVFTGGEDVDPSFYAGQDTRNLCYTNYKRDLFEERVFNFCLKHEIKITGICRGFQLLNVLSGGKMYQHINNHAGYPHKAYFSYHQESLTVTSTHHQLVMPTEDAVPIMWSEPRLSDLYIGPYGIALIPPEIEIEGAIFPSTKSVGVQFHPEMMSQDSKGHKAYLETMSDYLEMPFDEFMSKYKENNNDRGARQEASRT